MKTCSKCGKQKGAEAFKKNRTCKDGLHVWCLACNRANTAEYAAKNRARAHIAIPERKTCPRCGEQKEAEAFAKDRASKDWLRCYCRACDGQASRTTQRYKMAKHQAKSRGLDWTLTEEQFWAEVARPCHYCGNELHAPSVTNSGLDRLDNAKGYLPGNVVSCCRACNTIKSHYLTPSETKAAVRAVLHCRSRPADMAKLARSDYFAGYQEFFKAHHRVCAAGQSA